jgi:hypothetical protein
VKVNRFFYLFSHALYPDQRLNPIKLDETEKPTLVGVGERARGERCERASRLVFRGELDDLSTRVVFLCHAYKIPQPRKNARDFLRLKKYFFCA